MMELGYSGHHVSLPKLRRLMIYTHMRSIFVDRVGSAGKEGRQGRSRLAIECLGRRLRLNPTSHNMRNPPARMQLRPAPRGLTAR